MKWKEPAVNRMLLVMIRRPVNTSFFDCLGTPGWPKTSPENSIGAMNSRFTSSIRLFLILVFVCATSIGTAATQGGGRLIILRSPTFGWNIVLNLKMDGRTVANVRAGTPLRSPCAARAPCIDGLGRAKLILFEPTSTVLNVRPGQTYVFTGSWDGSNRVVLIPSALPPGQPY